MNKFYNPTFYFLSEFLPKEQNNLNRTQKNPEVTDEVNKVTIIFTTITFTLHPFKLVSFFIFVYNFNLHFTSNKELK